MRILLTVTVLFLTGCVHNLNTTKSDLVCYSGGVEVLRQENIQMSGYGSSGMMWTKDGKAYATTPGMNCIAREAP